MKTVTLIDDSRTILMSMSGLLRSAGFQTESFERPQDALERLRDTPPPAAVITDLNMPEMDGIMLIREARKIPSCRFIPILVLTTESQAAKRIEAKAAGATGWLVKPVTTETLIQVLGKVIPE